jgi:hypothetical protein
MMEEKGVPATMTPEDAARYWREQHDWAQQQLEVERAVGEKLGDELREALAAVKTLARLLWNDRL